MGNTSRVRKIVAIAGLKGSGKDTAADMLLYILNVPKFFRHYWIYKILGSWNWKWRKTSFAKPLKKVLSDILNVPVKLFEDRSFKESYYVDLATLNVSNICMPNLISEYQFSKFLKNKECIPSDCSISIRQLMQYIGTDCLRTYLGDNVWINATLNNNNSNIIISDLRFKAELKSVYEHNGKIIYIKRNGCEPGNHNSEREVLEMENNHLFDYIVENNGTLKELFNNLCKLF